MRNAIVCIAAFLCLTPLASAAGLEGKWSAEFKASGKKANAKKAGAVMLNLTSDGKQLSGSVGSGKRSATIQEGKVDGSSFSFVTIQKGKKGEAKMFWSGTLDGDTIQGARSRDGAKRRASFVAKRM
ncbi:MAG TPA: hypothetical protein VL285_04360 [Bryobacteraceae bacterium]|jgi:hypothetical protein|nr:hypothetical protein [Bryobacteraceae bacterium]